MSDRWGDARAHDRWFREQVEEAIAEADDPTVQRIPHDDIRSAWHRQRADVEKHLR